MSRPQFTLRALLALMLAVACWFGGIHFERERQRREDEAAARQTMLIPSFHGPDRAFRITLPTYQAGIKPTNFSGFRLTARRQRTCWDTTAGRY